MHHAKPILMLGKGSSAHHNFCLLWKCRRGKLLPCSRWHHTHPEGLVSCAARCELPCRFPGDCNKGAFIDNAAPSPGEPWMGRQLCPSIWFITERKPSFDIIYGAIWSRSRLLGWLCVNWEADDRTTRQRATVDSELCLGLHVSLLTANWHHAQSNKVHHPHPEVTACVVCLQSVCVVSWSRTLLESQAQNLLNLWCDFPSLPSPSRMMCYSSARSKWFGHRDWSKMIMARPIKLVINYCHKRRG